MNGAAARASLCPQRVAACPKIDPWSFPDSFRRRLRWAAARGAPLIRRGRGDRAGREVLRRHSINPGGRSHKKPEFFSLIWANSSSPLPSGPAADAGGRVPAVFPRFRACARAGTPLRRETLRPASWAWVKGDDSIGGDSLSARLSCVHSWQRCGEIVCDVYCRH